MWIIAAVLTMLCFGINNMIFKVTSGKGLSKVHMQFFYLVAFLLMLGYGMVIGFASFNGLTMVLGAIIGILNATVIFKCQRRLKRGLQV